MRYFLGALVMGFLALAAPGMVTPASAAVAGAAASPAIGHQAKTGGIVDDVHWRRRGGIHFSLGYGYPRYYGYGYRPYYRPYYYSHAPRYYYYKRRHRHRHWH